MENTADTTTYSLFMLLVGIFAPMRFCDWLKKLALVKCDFCRWREMPETQLPSIYVFWLLLKIVGFIVFLLVVIPPLEDKAEAFFMIGFVVTFIHEAILPILEKKAGRNRMWGSFLYFFLPCLAIIIAYLTVVYSWGLIGYVSALSLYGIGYLIYLFLYNYNQKKHQC